MPYIPKNLVQFSIEYRMGRIIAPKRYAIDDLNAATHSDDLYNHFCGLFLEESEIIFVKIPQFENTENDVVLVPSDEVISVHPLSDSSAGFIAAKVDRELLGEPLGEELYREVLEYRNREIATRGGEFLMRLFGIEGYGFIEPIAKSWFEAIEKFRKDQNYFPESLLDFMMTYERTKAFNKNDVGVLEDAASLLKQYSGLPDGWSPMEGEDSPLVKVLERLKKVAVLRGEILSSDKKSLVDIIERVNCTPVFEEINNDLAIGGQAPLRFFQILMIYLKLRELIRLRLTGDTAARFYFFAKDILLMMPKEGAVALYLAGMRFGVNEFVSMFVFVKYPPLTRPVDVVEQEPEEEREFHPARRHFQPYKEEPFTLRAEPLGKVIKKGRRSPTKKRT